MKVSSQEIQKRRNISVHNSVQSNVTLDEEVKLGKRFHVNQNLPKVSSQEIQKQKNITVHNTVQSIVSLDGGVKQKVGKKFIQIPTKGIKTEEMSDQGESKVLKPFEQGNFQEQMEMFNMISKEGISETSSFDGSNLGEDVGSSSGSLEREMPTLNRHSTQNLSNEITKKDQQNVLHYGDKKINNNTKSLSQHNTITMTAASKSANTKKEKVKEVQGNPTQKSTIGPIGETSRMVNAKVASPKNLTHQENPSQQPSQKIQIRNVISSVSSNHVNNINKVNVKPNDSYLDREQKNVVIARKNQSSSPRNHSVNSTNQNHNQQQPQSTKARAFLQTSNNRNGVGKSRQRRQIKLEGNNLKQIASM